MWPPGVVMNDKNPFVALYKVNLNPRWGLWSQMEQWSNPFLPLPSGPVTTSLKMRSVIPISQAQVRVTCNNVHDISMVHIFWSFSLHPILPAHSFLLGSSYSFRDAVSTSKFSKGACDLAKPSNAFCPPSHSDWLVQGLSCELSLSDD